ncbi:SGNH hydrolase domain-containing protein [Aquabacterium sp. OR-4]|uniref:SGNH hydrolase domain-containing protein n=1 Tax=Aquabacterium sp. OR-4 TaxID=2978127 RepID=UPI0021B2F001|nr:SGNH hydrolase domain-containing protein [Aquabacterium sp. OR-4]MDT7835870.1 SGNH hydrolase domain-containing protein [Aquabacterium sp. OR-4]
MIGLATWFRPQLTLSKTGQQSVWNYTFDIPDTHPHCSLDRQVASVAGGFRYSLSPVGCAALGKTVFVAGDSHAGAYMAALRSLVRQEAVKVVLYTRPGCPVFGMRRPIADEEAGCAAFVSHVLAEIQANARAGDRFFLPGLRLTRYRDSWDDGNPAQAETSVDRSAAIADAQQRLGSLADVGVHVILEAPKPLFKAPPFRCADWFNASNPICADGFSVPRNEIAQRRAEAMAALGSVAATGPAITIYDPLPHLCDEQICRAFVAGQPLFFDGDHLSARGNAVLYDSLSAALRN